MLEQFPVEDARLTQRINAAAAGLHRVWSASWLEDPQSQARRARVTALQLEIDALYEQRRHLVAQRTLLRDAREAKRRYAPWVERLAA